MQRHSQAVHLGHHVDQGQHCWERTGGRAICSSPASSRAEPLQELAAALGCTRSKEVMNPPPHLSERRLCPHRSARLLSSLCAALATAVGMSTWPCRMHAAASATQCLGGTCSCTDLRKLYSLGRKALRTSTWCQALGKAFRKLSTMSHRLAWLPACLSPKAPSTRGAKVLRWGSRSWAALQTI